MTVHAEHTRDTPPPGPRPDRTPAGIRRCLLPEDLPVFDQELRDACRVLADEGVTRLDVLQSVLSRWYTMARFSMDSGTERARRETERRILAGEYRGGSPWRDVAAKLGIPLDESEVPIAGFEDSGSDAR